MAEIIGYKELAERLFPFLAADNRLILYAIRQGDAELLQWALENGCVLDANDGVYVELAAQHGHLHIIEGWLCTAKNKCIITDNAYMLAIREEHSDVLHWLIDKQYPSNENLANIFKYAIANGHVEIAKQLFWNEPIDDIPIGYWAALYGRLELLQEFRRNGPECINERACVGAAEGGRMSVLKWLHKFGFPWDVQACAGAAANGHLNILKWLHKHGCPWDAQTCTAAAKNGHVNILYWAIAHGCPCDCTEMFHLGYVLTKKRKTRD